MTDIKVWLKGLVAAALGGAVAALAGVSLASIQDPETLAKLALAGALTHVVAYLKNSPVTTK